MCFDKCIRGWSTRVTTATTKIENLAIAAIVPMYPLAVITYSPAPPRCPRQLLICFPSLQICCACSRISNKWNQSYSMYFSGVWLSSLRMFLRFIHVMCINTKLTNWCFFFFFFWVKGGAMNSHVKLEDVSQNPSGQIRTMVTLCIWAASYLFQQLSFF